MGPILLAARPRRASPVRHVSVETRADAPAADMLLWSSSSAVRYATSPADCSAFARLIAPSCPRARRPVSSTKNPGPGAVLDLTVETVRVNAGSSSKFLFERCSEGEALTMPESTVRASNRGARTSSSSHTASEMSCPPMSKAASDEFRRSALASAVQPSRVSPLSVRSRWTSAVRAGIVSHTSATPLSPTPLPARPRLSNRLQRDSPATRAPAPAAPTRL